MGVKVRDALTSDIPQVHAIFEHYVLNTIVSFLTYLPPVAYIQSRYESVTQDQKLPYLVAVDEGSDNAEKVIGYAYASGFRGFMIGYGPTAEVTIFCHPQYTRRGVGDALMRALLDNLKGRVHICHEANYEDEPVECEIKQVLAIMSIDEKGPRNGMGLRDWYHKWGFEEVGRLRKVGWKKGKRQVHRYLFCLYRSIIGSG